MRKLLEFDNGLRLVVVENNSVRSVAVGVYVAAGVVTEKSDEAGISHLIEHMAFKGTEKRSSFDIVDETDKLGANINAATAKSYTMYYIEGLDTYLESYFDILSDLYYNPKFDPKELEKEKKVVFEEIHESEDDPFDVLTTKGNSISLEGTQYANEILGSEKSLKKIDSNKLKEYHDKWYVPKNTVISVAGNVKIDEVIEFVKKYFDTTTNHPLDEVSFPKAKYVSKSITTSKDITQSHIALYFPLDVEDNDEYKKEVVSVLNYILDGGMSSRLFQNIREKLGVCYSIGCMKTSYRGNNGRFIIYTSTSPNKVEKTIKAIRKEIDKLLKDGVFDEELAKAKAQLKTSLALADERTRSVMNGYANKALFENKLFDADEMLALVDKVSKEDLLKVAKEIFNLDHMCTSYVSKDIDVDLIQMMKK